MPVMIALLRGINLAGRNRVKMDELRKLCEFEKLRSVQTHIQSGNIVFATAEKDVAKLAKRLEEAIERKFGFHADVVVRSVSELKRIIARSPFASRKDLNPGLLTVTFLGCDLEKEKRDRILAIKAGSEEVKLGRRELYIYYSDGIGKSKLMPALDRVLERTGTFRNWNTVTKLLEMAEAMEAISKAHEPENNPRQQLRK
jgi:uncharacterized protein (DUF1697 family)